MAGAVVPIVSVLTGDGAPCPTCVVGGDAGGCTEGAALTVVAALGVGLSVPALAVDALAGAVVVLGASPFSRVV